jgi:hypothetical protein
VYGGADIGECLATAARIKGTDLDSWYSAWTATATATADMAGAELAAGRVEAARGCFFRASSYFRTTSPRNPPRDGHCGGVSSSTGSTTRSRTSSLTFTAAEGADDHCEAGARTLFHARAFGWLSEVLARES